MKRILSIVLALCMVVTLLPMTALAAPATYVSVGGVMLTYEGTPVYATTNASGAVTTDGATAENYNVKFENDTLTLRNATINVASGNDAAISPGGNLTIVAEGVNSVSKGTASSVRSATIQGNTLTLQGNGTLTVISQEGSAVQANTALTVGGNITLIAVGGEKTNDRGGCGLYCNSNGIVIQGNATVTAVGGQSQKSDAATGSAGIFSFQKGVTIQENATVTAVGGDTTAGGYSAGIASGQTNATNAGLTFTGTITIGGNAKVVAVGGKSGTASYGLFANDGTGTGTITYNGGLLAAKGGSAITSKSMNKALTNSTDAATTSLGATNESPYCVVSPKPGGTADYFVVYGSVSGDVTNHITWNNQNCTLDNTVIIGNAAAALQMQSNKTLTLSGFNVLLGGDSSVSRGVIGQDLTINGTGSLVAISGAASGDTTVGIHGVHEISATGRITAIGGSGENGSYGIFSNTLEISDGNGVGIAGKGGVGGSWAFSGEPTTTGLATTGAWNGKVMTWGEALLLPSTTPATDTPTVAKMSEGQTSVTFTLTTYPAGDYKVYADGATTTEHGTVIASLSGSILTLSGINGPLPQYFYISVTEPGKTESARLELIVGPYVPAPMTCHLTVNLNGGNGGTVSGDYAPGTPISINAGTKAGYTFSGWTATLGGNFADASSPSTTFAMPPNDTSITANWSYSGGGGDSSSNDNNSVIITPPAPDKPNSPTQGEIKVPGTVDGKGNVTISITDKTVTDAFEKTLAAAKKHGNEQNGITVVLRVDTGNKIGSHVTVNLPKSVQDTIIAKKIVSTIVVVDNPDIRVGMDLATVKEINKQAKTDVNITATRTDSGKLAAEAKKAIGSRSVFELKVNYGNGKAVSSFGAGSVSVTIPYTLGANEKAENVQAVYVDGDGKVHWLANSVYDSVEKVLRFSTNHFSTYGIGYKQANTAFTDIAAHWAEEDIEFVVSRGLFSGTSATTFSPNTAMTRGMFVTALGRLADADVSGYTKSSFTDVKSDAYYMGYIEWASKNSIANGIGNNKFAPDQSITREQMAVIMLNYAKVIDFTLPKVHAENTFVDSAKISAYAKDAVKQIQIAGVISGKNGNLFDPQGTATRAEVTAVLRRFVEMAISSDIMQGWTRNGSGRWMY